MIKITYLIPVFNEKKTVTEAINQILKLKLKDKEIIIIDNGSTDGSQELIKNFKKKNIKIILRKKNLGYGATVKQGVKMSRGKYMYIQFSDIEYDHNISLKMYSLAKKKNLDAVFGSRLKNMNFNQKIFAIKKKPAYLATILITFLYNFFYKKNFTDVIGSKFYKVSSIKKIIDIGEDHGSFDFVLKNKLISGNFKISEIYTKYWPRKINAEKKIKIYHIFPFVYQIFKYKFFTLFR